MESVTQIQLLKFNSIIAGWGGGGVYWGSGGGHCHLS